MKTLFLIVNSSNHLVFFLVIPRQQHTVGPDPAQILDSTYAPDVARIWPVSVTVWVVMLLFECS